MAEERFEFGIVEWNWSENEFRVDRPGGHTEKRRGAYAEVVDALSALGADGWDVATSVADGTWILWTIRRRRSSW